MPDVLTAAAAVAAATISLINLVVTTAVSGRRERTRWTRDSLTGAFVAFLDASWRHSDAVEDWRRVAGRDAPGDEEELAAERAYDDMRSQLTRLRLLASTAVSEAGLELLRQHRSLGRADAEQVGTTLAATAISRRRFIDTARREIRVG